MTKKRKKSGDNASKKPNVDSWLEMEDEHKKGALETGSREFDDKDALSVHTLESIYGKESGFGKNRGRRGVEGAAGDFQLKKQTAVRYGLTVNSKNDERFDIDKVALASAKYLKTLDGLFSKVSKLGLGLKTIPVSDSIERKKFTCAAFNAGEGRIAKAQQLAKAAGNDPTKWNEVKGFLKEAGARDSQVTETRDYIEKITGYEKEFNSKSKASERSKNKASSKIHKGSENGHWITDKNGKHIFIEDEEK